MDKARPEYFERLYAKMLKSGLKPATVHQVHRVARTAFGEAYKRGVIKSNPVALAKAPRVEEEEVEPLEGEEIQRVVTTALKRRNGVRFVVALALGARQGEALGFKWENLNRTEKAYRVKKALQRQTWQHGCADPHACGAKYHKNRPCREGCKRHTRACPPPCPDDCTSHARWCPQRHGGGLVEVPVKSRAGQRTFVLPDELYELLILQEKVQHAERVHAGTEWHEGGWMFTQPNGRPIDPRRDLAEWKSILEEAGVRETRLHDARHTAATVLLLLGVDPRVVMAIMGWSTEAQRRRYMHVTAQLQRGVAEQLNAYFWKGGNEGPSGGK
jgi:integrase